MGLHKGLIVSKGGDGNFYLTKVTGGSGRGRTSLLGNTFRNWFLIKNHSNMYLGGKMHLFKNHYLYFPKDMIGKRIRFKIEIIEGKK